MGNAILDVVLGLVLVYLVLALLATKVQEWLDGNLLRGRVSTLHQLMLEACGQSEDLKKQVMANPLIFALYRGSEAEKNTVTRSSGPSSVPADLFARALLMALNDGGHTHPSGPFTTPASFMEARAKSATTFPRTWQSLGGLIVGQERSWPGFEAAIAQWFADIGDRSDGWFKRRAQSWSLVVALGLCALLNADSLHIAQTLASDSEQRSALADIALRLDAQRKSPADASTAAPPAERPEVLAAARLTDAISRLSDAAQRDKGFGSFAATQLPKQLSVKVGQDCPSKEAVKGMSPVLPAVDTVSWLYILPMLRTQVELARSMDDGKEARALYTETYNCLAHLSSWLAMASTFSTEPAARGLAQDATVAIESAKSALLSLRDQNAAPLLIKRAFLNDPETFAGCAEVATTRSEFEACLQRSGNSGVRLPLLFIGSTVRAQFCTVARTEDCQGSACRTSEPAPGPWCSDAQPENKKLGLPALRLIPKDTPWMQFWLWIGGIAFTACFVALGAPFWFDVLGKVANLRAAGSVRDAADDAKRGRGTLPPPPPAPAPTDGRVSPAGAPFPDARNPFELTLTIALTLNLQQVLGCKQSGRLDEETRRAIKKFCVDSKRAEVTEELDRELFYAITGRDLVKTAAIPASLQPDRSSSWVQPVASKLCLALGFKDRIPKATTHFDADVRALTVLYRYKAQAGTPIAQRTVVELAIKDPAALDVVDASLIAEIDRLDATKPFPREAAGWLDWALGELGQVEKNEATRATSNLRICKYLDVVAGGGDKGDKTPWCGAFAAWVITQYNAACAVDGNTRVAVPPADPLRASNWANWGSASRVSGVKGAAALVGAMAGDVVLFEPEGKDSSGHVAFFVEFNNGVLRVLGGNQTRGSRVSLIEYPADKVVTVRVP